MQRLTFFSGEIEPEKLENFRKVVEVFKEMPKLKPPKFPETIINAPFTVGPKCFYFVSRSFGGKAPLKLYY